jgi:anti-sigma B factor antagonist
VNSPLGQDPALLLMQEALPMFSVDLTTRDCVGHAVVALRGGLDIADAAGVTAAFAAAVAREPGIIVDLAGLEFIDCSGVAALVRGQKLARLAGGELRLARDAERRQPRAQDNRVRDLAGVT